MSPSSLEALKLVDIQNKYDGSADGDLDGTGDEGSGGSGFEGHDVYELFARLAVLADHLLQGGEIGFIDADKERGVAFTKKATG